MDRRGLDWGAWQPDFVYFKLPLPKVTTRVMCEFVTKQDLPLFIQEARRVNPGLSIQEARKDFFLMIGKITEAGQKTKTKDQKQLN